MVGGGHLLPRLLWDVGAERSAIYLISVIFRKMNLAASVADCTMRPVIQRGFAGGSVC